MRETLQAYISYLYGKGYNATATAIDEDLRGAHDTATLMGLWKNTEDMRRKDGFSK